MILSRSALSLALVLGLTASCLAQGTEAMPQEATAQYDYDWVFVYYMAYDNNLEACGRPIIDMLGKGVTSDRTAVVVSADFRNANGMERYVLTKDADSEQGFAEEKTQLEEEGMAEEETLQAEMTWVAENMKAKKYAIVFLNHGGRLGEMSYDERPGKEGGQNWLYPPEVAKVLAKFRRDVSGEVELMFYQQCGKGTLENYHAMKDVAKWVMGSQTVVGAPNYYYTKAIQAVCDDPSVDGAAVAKLFTNHETPNMFTTYTTMDTAALAVLPAKVDAVLKPILAIEGKIELPSMSREFRPCFNFGRDELMFDGIALLDGLYSANELDQAPLEVFKSFVKDELISNHRVSPMREGLAGSWCGFSIFFPTQLSTLEKYATSYSLYESSELDTLLRRLLTPVPAPKASTPKKAFK